MYSCTDQLGNHLIFRQPARRIISLVPSLTELLYDLQLDEEVVGITKFCIHPEAWFRQKTRVGGTKKVNAEIVDRLQPDLIIASKEENLREQVAGLARRWPVWVSDIANLQNALQAISIIGNITGRQSRSLEVGRQIQSGFATINKMDPPLKTAYLIWQRPYMTVGGDTFINDMLERCGLQNIFAAEKRYPQIGIDQLQAPGCELVLLSSEPFPFAEKHRAELQAQLPGVKIMLADGEMFSWYGSRMLQAPAYFNRLLTGMDR